MRRSNVNVGTRDEVLAELDKFGADRAAQGNRVKAAEYARAIAIIEAGEDVVRVRHSVWLVANDGNSPDDGEMARAVTDLAACIS